MGEELEKLQKKVELYEYMLNNTSAIMFLDNASNQMLWCNQRHEDLFGLTKDDVNEIGLIAYVQKYLHNDDVDIYQESLEYMSNNGNDQTLFIYRQKDKNGNWRKILNCGKVSKWDDNNLPLEGVFCGIDITDQFAEFTRFEELLKENLYLKNKLKLKDLTRRETQILKRISEGLSTKEIADVLSISFNTVETHRKNIKNKLGINKVSELVRFAVECGL